MSYLVSVLQPSLLFYNFEKNKVSILPSLILVVQQIGQDREESYNLEIHTMKPHRKLEEFHVPDLCQFCDGEP